MHATDQITTAMASPLRVPIQSMNRPAKVYMMA